MIYLYIVLAESYVVCEPAEHYYIFNASNIGMQVIIQLKPIMQLYIVLDPSFKNQPCGKYYFNNFFYEK